MKIKNIFFSSVICLSFLFIPLSASAIDLGTGIVKNAATGAGYSANTTQTTLSETLGTVVKGALSLVGVIFMILTVYAGFLWMTAHGQEEQIEKAQDIVRSSIIGLIITLGAYSITSFVLPKILSKTTGSSNGPTACTGVCRSPSGNDGCQIVAGGATSPGACADANQVCCQQ